MAGTTVPGQTGGERVEAEGRPPVEPAVSEATRLLCAGAHVDRRFRSAVIDELYLHEERFTAPSYGIDAARVLAHAVYARRLELGWALGLLALWCLAGLLVGAFFLMVLLPCLLLSLAPRIRGTSGDPSLPRRLLAFLARWYGRLVLTYLAVTLVLAAFFGDTGDGGSAGYPGYADYPRYSDFGPAYGTSGVDAVVGSAFGAFGEQPGAGTAWLLVLTFVLLTLCTGLRRRQAARSLTGPLSPAKFSQVVADPAELMPDPRAQRLKTRIRYEQHSPLIMYHAAGPFRGAGHAFHNWTLGVELRPRKDRKPEPVDNRTVLDRIRPLVADLAKPSAHSRATAEAVRDRLRELRIDECVFLPADGIPAREGAPFEESAFEEHRVAAVEEGGEARRHFLRIRVGGWEEEIVVTVFVRVHTQGGMLMIEFAPHVLQPVNRQFREAEREAHLFVHSPLFGQAVWAFAHAPRSLAESLVIITRHLVQTWRLLAGGHRGALPDGPATSVRERGSDPAASLFQEMDVFRYLKSVEDRVADGVKRALYDAGWQTAEFEQKVVNVSGGVYIDSVTNSAVGVGSQNTISTDNRKNSGGSDDHD